MSEPSMTPSAPVGSPKGRYLHATAVLPRPLVAEIQRHVFARYIWIPSPAPGARLDRDVQILAECERGDPPAEVAERYGLTERRVYQIRARAKGATPEGAR